jgi:Zn-dependent protease
VLWLLRHPVELLGVAIALVIGVVVHSLVQAGVARALGDRMPVATGRLHPDPRRHLEPFGVIVMLLSGVGWPKPVGLQEPRFRGARGRYVLAVLAGPLANLAVAALAAVGLSLIGGDVAVYSASPRAEVVPGGFLVVLVVELMVVNAAMGVLTLIPLPPLDGARILWLFAPSSPGWRNARYHLEERNIGLGIVIVLMLPLLRTGQGLLLALVSAISGAFLAPLLTALHVPHLL